MTTLSLCWCKSVTTLRGETVRHSQKRRQDRRTPKYFLRWFVLMFFVGGVLGLPARAQDNGTRWTEKKAAEWYAAQPWLVGSNYIPATAINELEMWQGGTLYGGRGCFDVGLVEGGGVCSNRAFL